MTDTEAIRVASLSMTIRTLPLDDADAFLMDTLTAERRATVERIRTALDSASARAKAREPETAWHDGYLIGVGEAYAILNEEAAR